LHINIFH